MTSSTWYVVKRKDGTWVGARIGRYFRRERGDGYSRVRAGLARLLRNKADAERIARLVGGKIVTATVTYDD